MVQKPVPCKFQEAAYGAFTAQYLALKKSRLFFFSTRVVRGKLNLTA